jgi:radical SAM superfamily enzyme YgiQ (UPF0313 family)
VIPYSFLIIGNPYENEQDLIETIRCLEELPAPHSLRTYNLVFFPNTLLYEMAVADKIISGERGCGYQLDYLAGLNTQRAEWKNRNLYLNSILDLMVGKITPRRLGIIPRVLLEPMIRESIIRFNNRNMSLSRPVIAMKMQRMRLRSRIAEQVK